MQCAAPQPFPTSRCCPNNRAKCQSIPRFQTSFRVFPQVALRLALPVCGCVYTHRHTHTPTHNTNTYTEYINTHKQTNASNHSSVSNRAFMPLCKSHYFQCCLYVDMMCLLHTQNTHTHTHIRTHKHTKASKECSVLNEISCFSASRITSSITITYICI